ncbi:PTS sugar transporter subunit IIB [Parafrigoribacterium soli]|uniref:PTS sugar transporter subunit IIB n=1 Tax=Parafrigoribacterium soli TaxID=3144663 RepID=UPI0032EF5173
MQRILVVCGAGASSTFLVHWMRRVAASRGLQLAIDAGSQADVAERLGELSAVLVGSHLADEFARLRGDAAAAGVPAILLPPLAFDAAGASKALDLLDELLTPSADDGVAIAGSPTPGSSRG